MILAPPKRMILSAGLMCLAAISATAQIDARRKAGDPPRPASGIVRCFLEPLFVPTSLQKLVAHSFVIVDTEVAAVQPARLRDASDPASVETDSILTANSVLKAGGVKLGAKFVISQTGGQYGKLQLVAQDVEIVRQEQRYVLFLVPDTRPNLPTYGGLSRFVVDGIWHGSFAVIDGKIRLNPASLLKAYDNMPISAFLSQVAAALAP